MGPAAPEPRALEDLELHLELSGPWLDRKIAALRCQATQTAPIETAMGEDVFRRWVAVESFVELRRDRVRKRARRPDAGHLIEG
jgi:hypothetical protein